MKKRLLSLFCALSLLLTLLPTGVFAVEAGNEEATAQAGDTGAVKVAAAAEWEELTLTPITASPDGGDLPVLFAAEDGAEAPAEWSKTFFGDQLTKLLPDACYTGSQKTQGALAKELYDKLCAADSATLQKGGPISITLEQADPYPESGDEQKKWLENYKTLAGHLTDYEKVYGSITASAIAAFDRDRSDIFWLGGSKTKCATAENGVLLNSADGSTFTPKENAIYSMQLEVTFDISNSWKATNSAKRDIAADTDTVTKAVAAIKTEAAKESSRYNQLKAVHDYLTKNNAYNEDALKDSNKNSDGYLDTTPWEAISALTNAGGLNPVCEGYARAFKLICDALDIPCVLVSGQAGVTENDQEPHMWNYVRMEDDKWYAVDVTWDDPVLTGGSSGDGRADCFLIGADTQVEGESFDNNHTESGSDFLTGGHAAFTYPALNKTKYDSTAAAKKSIAKAVIHLADQQSFYAGEMRSVKTSGAGFGGWVTLDGKALSSNSDYRIVSGNWATDVGENTLTIEGKGDYTGTATAIWSLQKATPTADDFDIPSLNAGGYVYTGKPCVVPTPTLKEPKTGAGTVTVHYEGVDDTTYDKSTTAPTDAGVYNVTCDVAEGQNYIAATGLSIGSLRINQIAYSVKDPQVNSAAKIGTSGQVDLSGLIAPGGTAAIGDKNDTNNILGDNLTVTDKKLNFSIKDSATAKQTATVEVKVTAKNYKDYTIKVTLTATNKTPQAPLMFTNKNNTTVTYGQTLQLGTTGGTTKGKVTYTTTNVGGTATVDDTGLLTATRVGQVGITATMAGDDTHEAATAKLFITVTQAPLTIQVLDQKIYVGDALPGAPQKDTHYTVKGLVGQDKLTGTAKLEYRLDGKEVTPNTTTPGEYEITLTGLTTEQNYGHNNYTLETRPGKLTISARPGGGSSGSSGSSSSSGGGSISGSGTVKTDTVTNPDGSVTKTETKRDGTVIETTTGKDGSVSKTTTNPNGSSVTETKAADGSTGTVKTDERGQTTAQTTLSSKAIETAKRNGEPVKAPVEVNATRDSSTAPTVKIELPRNSGDTNVEIPVTNVKPGTVAVIVHPDGTEEIVKNSLPTEDGIQLTVNGGATVKIVDNSKDFIDTRAHWAKDAIDFVSARGLVNGMSATIYAPNASTTRAQLWTILARQADVELNGGATWYEKAQLWSKDKGVSDGANPNAAINRAQMVTMLWRTMGQPAATDKVSFADVPAGSYYAQAVAWAVENGITAGVGGGRFDPNGACTRGQIATFLYRYMK